MVLIFTFSFIFTILFSSRQIKVLINHPLLPNQVAVYSIPEQKKTSRFDVLKVQPAERLFAQYTLSDLRKAIDPFLLSNERNGASIS